VKPRDAQMIRNAVYVSMARNLLAQVLRTDANEQALIDALKAIVQLQRATEDDEDKLTLRESTP